MSDGVEIMVMTIDSFRRATNVIGRSTDHLQGQKPIHLIQASRPVLTLTNRRTWKVNSRGGACGARSSVCLAL